MLKIAIKCHTQPGDEVICDADAHIYQYEGGGIAANSGASVKLFTVNEQLKLSIQKSLKDNFSYFTFFFGRRKSKVNKEF